MTALHATGLTLLVVAAALAGCADRTTDATPLFAEDHQAGSPGGATRQVTLVLDDATIVRFYAQPGPQDVYAATPSIPRWMLEAAAHSGPEASFSSLTHLRGDPKALADLRQVMTVPDEESPRPTVGGCGADLPSWRYTRFLHDNSTDTFRLQSYCPGDPALSDPLTQEAVDAHEAFQAFVGAAKR